MADRTVPRFGPDGTFTVMQVSDIQECGVPHPRGLRLLEAALDREKPDLVVFTGDQLKGYSPRLRFAGREERRALIAQTIDGITAPLEARGIPFTFTFGNHDHDAPVPGDEQVRYYRGKPLCLAQDSPEGVPGYANHVLPVLDAKGERAALLLYMLDSHGPKGLGYTPLDPAQVEWYRKTREEYFEKNGEYVPSMLFQHVPVEEIIELYREVPRGRGALEGYRNYAGRYFVLDGGKAKGFMGELPSSPDANAGLFEAAREKGELLGMFFGHDHSNGFHGDVRGITLGYAPGAGYRAYGPGRNRGARVIRFDERDMRGFETYIATDEALFGPEDGLDRRTRILMDMQPKSFGEVQNKLRRAAPFIAAIHVAAAAVVVGVKLARRSAQPPRP